MLYKYYALLCLCPYIYILIDFYSHTETVVRLWEPLKTVIWLHQVFSLSYGDILLDIELQTLKKRTNNHDLFLFNFSQIVFTSPRIIYNKNLLAYNKNTKAENNYNSFI